MMSSSDEIEVYEDDDDSSADGTGGMISGGYVDGAAASKRSRSRRSSSIHEVVMHQNMKMNPHRKRNITLILIMVERVVMMIVRWL